MKELPNWPGVMDAKTAGEYCRPVILRKLVFAGLLVPFSNAHKCQTFLKTHIDAALSVVARNGGADKIKMASEIRTIAQAIAAAPKRAA